MCARQQALLHTWQPPRRLMMLIAACPPHHAIGVRQRQSTRQPATSVMQHRTCHAAATCRSTQTKSKPPMPHKQRTCQAAATCSTTNKLAAAITPVGSLMLSSTSAGRGKRPRRWERKPGKGVGNGSRCLQLQAHPVGTKGRYLPPCMAGVCHPAWQVSATCTTPLRCLHLPRTLHAAPALPPPPFPPACHPCPAPT